MKKTYVVIILILIVVLILAFIGKGKKLEAPTTSTGENMENKGDAMKMGSMEPVPIPEGWNAPVSNTTAPVKEFVVTGQNFSFTPNALSAKKGDLVKITFKNAGGTHDLRIDEFKVATQLTKTDEEQTAEGQTISFIADQAGSFEYYCSVGSHRAKGMWGTLTVE